MKQRQKTTQEANQLPLTPNEKMVLEFITSYIQERGFSPTFQEIKDRFQYKSFFSVQQYITQLADKGYLVAPGENKKRAIELVISDSEDDSALIPLVGRVAAGRPIEAIQQNEMIDVSPSMLTTGGEYFALQVKGDSMINDGIMEDDIVIIKKQATAFNGQTVVALIDNEATIKCFFKKKNSVELHSANPKYKPIVVQTSQDFKIEGILHGLIRKFKR